MEAVIYARISADHFGQGLGVARQIEDCTAKAIALGWTVAETFTDNDVSASKDVERHEYRRMLDSISEGRIRAVVVYDLDRLTRRPAELEAFIDLTEKHGVALANVSGDVDLTSANGKMLARIKGAVARQEADRISERTARQKEQRVGQGKPLGQRFRTFGYGRDWSVIETEAAVVREVFDRIASGESQNSVTRDLVSRGIKTAADGVWTALQTSRMLKTPKYAGMQTFKGEIIGKSTVVPALVTETQYEAVQGKITGATAPFRKYLLSGILICDNCKNPMSGTRVKANGKENVRYRCDVRNGGCGSVSIKAEWVDHVVNRYVAWWYANEGWTAAKAEPVEIDNSAAIAEVDERIAGLQEAMGTGDMSIEDGLAAIKAARSQRQKMLREDAQRITDGPYNWRHSASNYWSLPNEDKRTWVKRAFKFIFCKPGKRSTKFDIHRLYVLTSDAHPTANQLLPLDFFHTTDLRDPQYGPSEDVG